MDGCHLMQAPIWELLQTMKFITKDEFITNTILYKAWLTLPLGSEAESVSEAESASES